MTCFRESFKLKELNPCWRVLYMSKQNIVVNALKKRVKELSFTNLTKNDVIRELKKIYYDNIRENEISYETYLEVTSYLVLLKAFKTSYV